MTGHELFMRFIECGGSSQHLAEQRKAWERLAASIEDGGVPMCDRCVTYPVVRTSPGMGP